MIPKELRLGNLVKYKPTGTIQEVTGIIEDGQLIDLSYNADVLPDQIEGVPLTPDLLGRFGFKQNENSDNWWNKEADCSIDVEPTIQPNAIELLFYYRLSPVRRKPIMYAHSLQNLHYALKDEELTLKSGLTGAELK